MRLKSWTAALALLWPSLGLAQQPAPADMGITPTTHPEVLQTLDSTRTWVPIGTVDPTTHTSAPATNGPIITNNCLRWGPGIADAGVTCGGGGGGGGPLTVYSTHAGLVATPTPTGPWTVMQQGFYAPGDGGEAAYNWNATSYCGGTSSAPQAADGYACVLPTGQSPSTAGRYLLNLTNGSINVKQFGMQPGGQDNSPFVNPLMAAISTNLFTVPGIGVVIPPIMGNRTAYYYFSEPFTVSAGGYISCGNPNIDIQGSVVLLFAGGVDGFRMEQGPMTATGGVGQGDINGCALMSLGGGSGNATAGGNTVTDLTMTGDTPPNHDFTPPSDCNSLAGGPCFPGAGDGFIVMSHYISGYGTAVAPGAYLSAVNRSTNTGTLASPYTIGTLNGSGVEIWDLPVKQKYTVTTTIGSPLVTVVSGPRLLRPGDKIWSDAFPFGSTVIGGNNQVISATVRTGGSGYVGTSGTMTGNAAPGCTVAPVLNVTASGGVITGVTSVSAGGTCNAYSTPNTWAGWTPGGGLSGGSGASFNMTFQQSSNITDITMYNNVNATVTHASGSGQMWVIPAGIARRAESQTHNNNITYFGFGIDNICFSGSVPTTGCNGWMDQKNSFSEMLVGHLHRGNTNGLGTAIGNTFAHNYITDEVDAVASIGSIFINEEYNSPENSSAYYGLIVACGAQNYSTYIGGYYSGQTGDPCMGLDTNGNRSIAVPTKGGLGNGLSQLFIGQMYGGPSNVASINGSGNMIGEWTYTSYKGLNLSTSSPTPSGTVVEVDNVPAVLMDGASVSDITTPAAIPANTTVVSFGGNSVTISHPVAGGGVLAGDTLAFYNPGGGPIYAIKPGMTNGNGNGFWMSRDGANNTSTSIQWDGYVSAWSVGTGTLWPSGGYSGYGGNNAPVHPNGVVLGGEYTTIQEARELSFADQLPTLDYHLQGDTAMYTWPTPGTSSIYTNAAAFSPYLAGAVTGGTTTSVAVTACPNPSLPAGTPIAVGQDVGYAQLHLGDLASCTGTTLTLQAAASNSAPNGYRIFFLRWYPLAPIANDTAGSRWTLGNYMSLTPVALASLPATCVAGTFAVINNGVASPTYNAAVGSTTGAATDPVFCGAGNVWTYH